MKFHAFPSRSNFASCFHGLLLGLVLAIGAAGRLAAQMTVDVQPDGPVTRCTGQGIVFSVVIVGGTPPYSYQWTKNGNDVPSQTGPTYTINPRTLSDEGNYNCKVTDSVLAYVNVVDPTPTFLDMQSPAQVLTQPTGGTICIGTTATISMTFGGTPPPTVVWKKGLSTITNGQPTGNGGTYVITIGSGTSSLQITNVQNGDAGSYTVTVSGPCGAGTFSETSNPAVLVTDTTFPVFTNCGDVTINTDPGICTGTFNFTPAATDNCAIFNVGPPVNTSLSVGPHPFNFSATDTAGNTTNCTMNVTVVDNQPPVLTFPAVPVFIVTPTAPIAVTFSVTAMDNCSATVNAVPASGSLFPAGRTTVNCSASDGTNVVTGSFDVFVCVNPPAPTTVWVDDNWVGLPNGTDVGSSRTIGCDAFATIQGGVDAVAAAGTVNVAAGSYLEDVLVGKVVAILGAGPASVVSGPIGGGGATFQFGSDGVVLDGFTITRQGNNVTDWNNTGLNSAGVAIQGRASGTVRNCVITGNRTGIDINNSTGISVHNDAIDDNRTGLIFRNLADNCAVYECSISSNWTVGVLFLDGSVGSNVPPQTANGALFSGNRIAGNWYGQIVDRQSGGSLPVPGANLKNFSANWLGTVTPVITTANSTEPGYAAQIPVAFGGGATPPGGQPDVCGPASANFDITPMLESGVDTNINLGNGVFGFQGNYSALTVTDDIAQTGVAGRVTEGATLVTVGGTVHVQAGTYVENASIAKRCTIDGAGSGGSGAANPATHTIVQAANASLPAISIAATGLNAGNRLVVRDLRTTGATSSDGIAMAVTPCDFLHIESVTSVGNSNGIHFGVSSGSANDVEITNCVLSSSSNVGLRIASAMSSMTALRVTGGEMKLNNVHGIGFNTAILASCFGDDFTIDGTVFVDNGSIIAGNGTGHVSLLGFNGSAMLKNLVLSGTAFNPIQLRGKTPTAPLGTVAFQNVVVSGSTPRPAVYIQVYTSLANLSFTGLNLSGMSSTNAPGGFFSNGGMILDHTGPSVPLGNTIFPCQGAGYVGLGMGNTGGAAASCATVFSGATSLAQKEACVLDMNDVPALGDVTFDDAYASVPPVGGTVCQGSPFTFTITAGGVGPFTYQWRKNGNPILGAMAPSYMIAAAALGDAGSYDVVITNACGSETSPAAVLTVNPLPVAPSSASSSPPSVCFGVGGTITLTASGGSGTTLEWRTGSCGGPLVGTGNGLVIAAPTAATTYFARWTTSCGMSACASTLVTVQQPPTVNAGGPYSTCYLAPVAVSGTANDAASVLWTTSGTGSFASPSSLVTSYSPSLADATAGSVTLTLTANAVAPCLTAASSNATLTFTGSPNVVYVDDGYVGQLPGAQVAFPFGGGGPLHTIGCDAFATIQGGVDAVAAPGTVNVAPGSYVEDVLVGKVVTILGAGAAQSTVSGPIGGPGATFQFASNGVVLDGFTITRQGNNVADWNNPLLNTAGVAIQGLTSGTVRNCFITGNRTGIDINNSTGISVHNDAIDDNRTGLIFRNVTDNCAVFECSISNNWTVGVLFLDGSGSGVPPQTANGALFSGNRIAGNWYGQIVDRQTGGALPLPGANLKNFSANWLGTVTPVITTANSAEPGYAAQIPVAFGGGAVPPGGQPDVCGPASANFDITPMLESGVDTNVSFGNGVFGFQGNYSALTVTDDIAQTGVAGRVTEGATLVTVGGTVHVQAGTYVENATVPKRCTIDGAGSGGSGAANPATHTIVQAANASLPAISIAATGLNAGNRLVLSDLRTTGATSSDGIAMAVTPCNFLHIEAVTSVGNSNGIHFGVSSGSANDVEITNCVLSSSSNVGLRIASAMSSTTALRVTGGEMKLNNVHGFGFNPSILSSCFGDDFTIDGTVFADNGSIIAGNGTGHVSLLGFNGSAMLKNLVLSGTAFNPIQLRGKTPSAPLGTVAFQNVVVSGSTPRPAVYIQVYTSLANLSFTGLNLSGMSSTNAPGGFFSNGGMILDHTGPSVALGNTIFPCQGAGYVGLGMGNTGGATANCSTVFGGATTLAQKETCTFDVNDFAGIGDVTFDDAYASVPPVGGTVCQGSPFGFNVTAGGVGPFTYQWRKNGNPILGAMSPSYMIAAAALVDAGSYDVVITNACGSETSPAAMLTVNPLPVAPSSASSSPPGVCFGVGGTITLTASSGSGTTLEWRTGSCGGPLVGTGNGLVIAAPTAATTYFARWTTICGISTCASVPVPVQLPPAAGAGGPYTTCHVTPVGVSGTANAAASVLWTTSGTGSFASPSSLVTSYTPSVADSSAGSVTLTLTANPVAPCLVAATSMATLTITPQSVWYQDADNDGFGNPAMQQLACVQPPGYVSDNTDCNDANPLVKPSGIEICNGIDDDCDNQIDEICAVNDHCATATAITNGSVSGNNALAGNEIGTLTCGPVVNDVWYSYTNTLSCPKTVTVSMCPADGGGASFDAVIHAFSGTCGSLALLACNNNTCGTNPKVTFTVAPFATAYIAVSAVAPGPGGSFTMIVSHATAQMAQLGPGCSDGGGPGPTLTLNALPILNQFRVLSITGAVPGSTGLLLMSAPPVSPGAIAGGCTLYVNQAGFTILTFIFTDGGGNFSLGATVPNDPGLECAQIVVQGVIFPVGGMPSYQVTSGLGLVLGY